MRIIIIFIILNIQVNIKKKYTFTYEKLYILFYMHSAVQGKDFVFDF